LKTKFLEEEKLVDIVVGPDAYRSLPALVTEAEGGQKAVNVLLSRMKHMLIFHRYVWIVMV
jgi:tRNA-2-methylthio-N6-dimethylallyladenosine synthase